ncbi:MAG: hypothetical protein ACPKM1_15790 [Spirochaetaceae bacterium]
MSDITNGTLVPQFKDYKSKKEVVAAFRQGKDFILKNITSRWDNMPCSIRDCQPGDMVKLRYNQLAHVCFYTVVADDLMRGTRPSLTVIDGGKGD